MAEEKKRKRKKEIKYQAVTAAAFLLALALICGVNLLHKDRKLSEKEMRVLAQKPELSLANVASGRFMKQYEEYVSDQFAGRDFWVQLKTTADSFAGKKEENGVFNGKKDYLLEDIAAPDEAAVQENLDAMKQFRKQYKDVQMHVMLVPNAANILKDHLPALAVTENQSTQIQNVKTELGGDFDWIETEKTLRNHRDEEIYYHTDHHWTTLGAYYAFENAKKQLGIADKAEVKMKAYGVSNNFNGTLSATSGYQTGYKEPIYVYLPEGKDVPGTVVSYVEEQKKSASMYDTSKLKERDQYAVFFGGNHAQIDIKTTDTGQDRLLVLKDSYANCMIPFLAPYYREIVVVDPRYYTGDLEKLVEEKKINRVLFLYNANTFFEDRMLSGVLPGAGTE